MQLISNFAEELKRVVIIGSGNVATSLAQGLSTRCEVAQIYSRQLAHAQRLADAIGCPNATDDLNGLLPDADVYLIAVRDDVIADVIGAVPDNGALWVHTSGSKGIDLFDGHRARCGVLWPMQSFTRELVVALDEVHFFAEGNSESAQQDVTAFAQLLSCHVHVADSTKRRQLHVASVFSCNFANHMWTLADEVLQEAGLPFEAMLPLIRTTVDKLESLSPAESQTGPAARCDLQVIANHLSMLDGDKRSIYDLLSSSIMKRAKGEDRQG